MRLKFYKNCNQSEEILSILIILILFTMGMSGICSQLLNIDLMELLPSFSLCLFYEFTGMPCPGCGMTRALISFGQLEFEQAIQFNPFSLPLLIAMILYLWGWSPPLQLRHKALIKVVGLCVVIVW